MMITPGDGPMRATYLRSRPLSERLKMRIPDKHKGDELEDARPSTALDAVKLYLDNWGTDKCPPGEGLTLFGPPRSGKSFLASGLLKALVRQNQISGRWVSSRRYLDMMMADIHGTWAEKGFQDPYALVYIRHRVDVLVLDGLGDERLTQQSNSFMGELIRDREDMLLTTIVTTTLTPEGLTERYGDIGTVLADINLQVPV